MGGLTCICFENVREYVYSSELVIFSPANKTFLQTIILQRISSHETLLVSQNVQSCIHVKRLSWRIYTVQWLRWLKRRVFKRPKLCLKQFCLFGQLILGGSTRIVLNKSSNSCPFRNRPTDQLTDTRRTDRRT